MYHARRDQKKKIFLNRHSMGVDRNLYVAFQNADQFIAVMKMRCKSVSVICNSAEMGWLRIDLLMIHLFPHLTFFL